MTACQRWLPGGTASWKRPCDGGFDPARYGVAAIGEEDARRFVTGHHYSRSYPAAVLRYGLFDLTPASPALAGVAVMSVPASKRVLTKAFPDLEPYEQTLELGRFVLTDPVPANGDCARSCGSRNNSATRPGCHWVIWEHSSTCIHFRQPA